MTSHTSQLEPKLLSHRLRGFAEVEHAPEGLIAACHSRATYLEMDLRLSAEGTFFVYHDAATGADVDTPLRFADSSDDAIHKTRLRNGEPIMSLDTALRLFMEHRQPAQVLVLDIKDFGGEQQLLDIVRAHKAEAAIVACTWMPQTLYLLHDLGLSCPLMFAHWNLMRFGCIGTAIGRIAAHVLMPAGKFAIIGQNRTHDDLGRIAVGYQHTVACTEIPEDLLKILRISKGAICVHRAVASASLASYCQRNKIGLWVYEVDTQEAFRRLALRPEFDAIFCNDCS